MSQFRQNPITKHWVLIAPNRARRPEQFASRPVMHEHMPELDRACVFCPGNESANKEIARFPGDNWDIRIITNKFEALTHRAMSAKQDFYLNRPGIGDHEVVITRKHNEPVALQSIGLVEDTLEVLRHRFSQLRDMHWLQYAQIFHNHGRDAGASLVHPHYQILSLPMVPQHILEELRGTYEYFRHSGSCIYCDIVREELKLSERVIYETDDFVVMAPYAARSPFETWIVPKRHTASFEDISADEIRSLSYVLKVTLGQLYTKLSDPPLNFYIHTTPFENAKVAGEG